MEINYNKKGALFTLVSILVISLFLLSYSIYYVSENQNSVFKRIKTMNNFIISLEKDFSRQGYISGYRAIVAIESFVTTNGSFINDSDMAIKEALLNGTINNQPVNLMEGYKLSDWNNRVQMLSEKVNVIVNYTLTNLTVNQIDPWNINIIMDIDMNVLDMGNLASWNRSNSISSKIEVTNFEDPLYTVNTEGFVANKIRQSPYYLLNSAVNITNLSLHSSGSYYIASVNAPSFLDRLEGKTTASNNGIESMVYIPDLTSQGIIARDKSVIDYIYFSNNTPSYKLISGMPAWFKLDDNHVAFYNLTSLVI